MLVCVPKSIRHCKFLFLFTDPLIFMSSFTDFGELVLVIGDFNIPFLEPDIPAAFKELLVRSQALCSLFRLP